MVPKTPAAAAPGKCIFLAARMKRRRRPGNKCFRSHGSSLSPLKVDMSGQASRRRSPGFEQGGVSPVLLYYGADPQAQFWIRSKERGKGGGRLQDNEGESSLNEASVGSDGAGESSCLLPPRRISFLQH